MFFKTTREKELNTKIKGLESERDDLKKEKETLTEEVERLKLKKKIEDEDIKHMVKIKEEKLQLDFQKKELELESKKNNQVAKVKDDYRDKVEQNLHKEMDRMQDMYKEILARLPNINVKMKGGA